MFVACLPVLGCGCFQGVDVDAEVLEIRKLDRLWLDSFARKDVDAAMRFFSADAVLMPAHAPAIVGRDSITAWFQTWLPNPRVSSTFLPDEIEVAGSGDLAYDRGTYNFSMNTPNGRVRDVGKYLIVWKKFDGEWKAILDISNSDLPTAELIAADDSKAGAH